MSRMERYHGEQARPVEPVTSASPTGADTSQKHSAEQNIERQIESLERQLDGATVSGDANISQVEDSNGKMKKGKKPKKKKKSGGIVYRIIMLILIAVIIYSGYNIAKIAYQYYNARQQYKEISTIAKVDPDAFTGEIDWAALRAITPDIRAWIYLEDTIVNYPVVQGEDNDYYLHRTMEGEYDFAGTIFVDSNCTGDFKDFNTIVYGHHMRDGSMFATLKKYTQDNDFYNEHKQFELITPGEKYHLIVFSSYVTNALSDTYQYDFPDDESKISYIDMVKSNSAIDTDPVDVTPDDRIVTLSTCVGATGNSRYVVIGKLVEWTQEEKDQALLNQQAHDAE